jgi:cytidine deaminase
MEFVWLDDSDRELIDVAQEVLWKNYVPGRHTGAAAVRCSGGRVYSGISIATTGYGTCAEPVALGAAFTNGEREVDSVVVVCRRFNNYPIVPPCGNCRQLLLDYVPDAHVILDIEGNIRKAAARSMLPGISVVEDSF